MNACTGGLLGRLFGHKFLKRKGGVFYIFKYCLRCGKETTETTGEVIVR
jgi:hypothetical protein